MCPTDRSLLFQSDMALLARKNWGNEKVPLNRVWKAD